MESEQQHQATVGDYKTHIAPSYWQIEGIKANVSGMFSKSYYVQDYPSYIEALRTREVLGFSQKRDMSFFIYKENSGAMQTVLRQKATQIKAELNEAHRKGITVDMDLEITHRDVETIRQKLATHEESYFETGCYFNLYHDDREKLSENSKRLEQIFS